MQRGGCLVLARVSRRVSAVREGVCTKTPGPGRRWGKHLAWPDSEAMQEMDRGPSTADSSREEHTDSCHSAPGKSICQNVEEVTIRVSQDMVPVDQD